MDKKEYNRLAEVIVKAAIEVHKQLGPGLLETVYEQCLLAELALNGVGVESQVKIPLQYKGVELNKHYMIDMLVEDEIILELKCVEELLPIHEVQLVTYLKLAQKKLGFLLNFNVTLMKKGIKRKINGYL